MVSGEWSVVSGAGMSRTSGLSSLPAPLTTDYSPLTEFYRCPSNPSEPAKYECVAPLLVSKVSRENRSEHGTPEVRVRVIVARISPLDPERPALEKARLTDEVTPEAIVKVVAVPMVLPVALTNATLPVQDGAVPPVDAVAMLVRFTRAVSVLPRPKGGRWEVRVVVVCAKATVVASAIRIQSFGFNMGSSFS
jgi:hypothetical protein